MNNQNISQNETIGEGTELTFNPFIFTCGDFIPGQAEAFLASVSDPTEHAICEAEMLYYRGFPEEAERLGKSLKQADSTTATLGAFLIEAVTSLSLGHTEQIMDSLALLQKTKPLTDAVPQLKKSVDFFLLYFNILTHNQKGLQFPEVSVNAFAVPDALMPMAIYAYAHYLILCGDFGRAIGLAEGMLIQQKRKAPVSEIYLSLITCVGYICRSEWAKADYYFMYAWETALQDGLFMPIAELKGMLSGMPERCIRHDYPEEYKKVASLFCAYHKNWVKVHNSLTGDKVTDRLTGTEMNVAMLASRGLSNAEIGDFLSISVNSVRSHLRNIFNKLGIANRKELKDYIIK